MFSARQLLLMRRTRDRAIYIDIAPFGTVVFLPGPDFRRRVFRCVNHVWLSCVDRVANVGCSIMVKSVLAQEFSVVSTIASTAGPTHMVLRVLCDLGRRSRLSERFETSYSRWCWRKSRRRRLASGQRQAWTRHGTDQGLMLDNVTSWVWAL